MIPGFKSHDFYGGHSHISTFPGLRILLSYPMFERGCDLYEISKIIGALIEEIYSVLHQARLPDICTNRQLFQIQKIFIVHTNHAGG